MAAEQITVPRRLLQLALDALEQARIDSRDFDFGPAVGLAEKEFNQAKRELRKALRNAGVLANRSETERRTDADGSSLDAIRNDTEKKNG